MKSMKKLLALLLIAVMVFAMGVSAVSAEETAEGAVDETDTVSAVNAVFPIVTFGKTVSVFQSEQVALYYDANGQLIQPTFREEKLDEDNKVVVLKYNGVAASGVAGDYAYYFLNDSLVAMVADLIIPEGFTTEDVRKRIVDCYGDPFSLSLESMGILSKLIGESAHLEEGQEAWNYQAILSPLLQVVNDAGDPQLDEMNMEAMNAFNQNQTLIATGTIRELDGILYMALFVDPSANSKANNTWTLKLSDLAGINDLSKEEQQKVSQYLDFMNYQLKKQAEEYILYIKQQHGAQ